LYSKVMLVTLPHKIKKIMKKIYKTLVLSLAFMQGIAQVGFWTPTTYKGAFDCSAAMWTDNWTNWDPQNTVYPAPTMTVSANITTNTTWNTGQTVLLNGQIYVTNNAVLTIQPGVIVRGSSLITGSSLIITKGAQINAAGTSSQPIVFTSDKAPGSRGVGDWGGIIILGKASCNLPGGIGNIEGLPIGINTEFGGATSPNDNDNSGTLAYLRNEFGGYAYQVNKEINALTLGAVGKGTTIHHIQNSFNNDDGYEWFGGTVDCKYLVSYRNLDDDFDCDNGFRGNVQFGLIVRDPALADNPSVSTSEGFECDNDAGGTTATPQTQAVFSNVTAIGPYRGSSAQVIASGYRRALRLRRNVGLRVFNSVFTDFKTGLFVDGVAADGNAGTGVLKFKHNIVAFTAGVTPKAVETTTANTVVNTTWFATQPNDSLITTAGILVTPYNYTAPDYRPVCTNSLVTGTANFSDPAFVSGGILSVNNLSDFTQQIGLYPNPNNGEASLIINANSSFDVSVEVYSVTGQLMLKPYTNYNMIEGANVLPINANELANGIYFISINNGTKTETIKMVVNK
jgi:hypothetical protein